MVSVLCGLGAVIWLGSENFSAFADDTDAKPVDQHYGGGIG